VKSANILNHQAMWFCSSPFGIAHHSAKSSRLLISGRKFFFICVIGALVRGISLLWCCFAAFTLSSRYCNTSFRAFVCKIRKSASWWFDCCYAFLRSIIAFSGSSELTLERLRSCRIWSEKQFMRYFYTKLNSDSSTRCCPISDLICV